MLNKSITSLVILLLISIAVNGQLQQSGIHFEYLSLQEALSKAKADSKLVFVDGYATWCGPCKRMDAETFPNTDVASLFDSVFVNIKLDMEKGAGLEVAKKYGIKAYPTFLFLDPEGKVKHKDAGFFEAEDFIEVGKMAFDEANSLGALQRKFDEGNKDSMLLQRLVQLKYKIVDLSYMQVAEAFAETQKDWDTPEMRKFIFTYTNTAASPLFDYIVENKKDFNKQFGQGATFGKIENLVRDRSFDIENTSLGEMSRLFKLVYPKSAKELSSKYRMTFYRQQGDRQNYALSAIDHYQRFPSKDPQELNEVGVTFSRVINDPKLLEKAIELTRKSITIEDAHYNNDTLAALLFKKGDISGAKKAAEKAIALARSEGEDPSYTIELLDVIKSH
ncbi:MAG: thioredoxin family protein [Bacteroidia bacterium]|nr:thioredoxin family protein [Bacteroidia bacterium]